MLRQFVRAIMARWFTAMSGPLTVPAAIMAAYASSDKAKVAFGLTALACLVFTAYWVWRAERLNVIALQGKLDPKLSLHFAPALEPFVSPTTLTDIPPGMNNVLYVRVLPRCNAQVDDCRGILVRVQKWEGGIWKRTAFDEVHDLAWSNHPSPSERLMTLYPNTDQYLDVFRIPQYSGKIEVPLVGGLIPNNAVEVFRSGGTFRFDIAVVGDGNARADISLKISTGPTWDAPTIEVYRSELGEIGPR
jgi:hypothetical protein